MLMTSLKQGAPHQAAVNPKRRQKEEEGHALTGGKQIVLLCHLVMHRVLLLHPLQVRRH
jgi:hypothetical protein